MKLYLEISSANKGKLQAHVIVLNMCDFYV